MNNQALQPGDRAPEFRLKATPDQYVSLSELRGAPVILVFYPADWSAVCGDQLALYNELLSEFEKYGASIVGISVDGVWSHIAFAHDRKYRFPLLADFEPKGEVAKAYGVYRSDDGTAERALFVVDADGVIVWSHVSPIGINPGANGILNALQSLESPAEDESDLTLPVSSRDHAWGHPDAPITLVEYGDYECPHCGAAHPVVKRLLSDLGSQVRFVFRNFPLTQIHPHAERAAEAAELGGDYGQFWAMHDLILENQLDLQLSTLLNHARSVGIDAEEFGLRLAQKEKLSRIKDDFMSGVQSGVNGTPTFFINGRRHSGGHDYDSLHAAMRSVLSS